MDCPFCGNMTDNEVNRLVYSNDLVFCIVNFEPIKPGHVMIIPRRHVTRVSELSPEESHAIHILVDRMVDTLERLYPDEPAAIHVNHARHKSVPHLHYHVLPAKGSLREHFVAHEGVEHRVRASTEESTATAKLLRQTMEK